MGHNLEMHWVEMPSGEVGHPIDYVSVMNPGFGPGHSAGYHANDIQLIKLNPAHPIECVEVY